MARRLLGFSGLSLFFEDLLLSCLLFLVGIWNITTNGIQTFFFLNLCLSANIHLALRYICNPTENMQGCNVKVHIIPFSSSGSFFSTWWRRKQHTPTQLLIVICLGDLDVDTAPVCCGPWNPERTKIEMSVVKADSVWVAWLSVKPSVSEYCVTIQYTV